MSADIFISYNREDQAIARHFAEAFVDAGLTVWWDVTLSSGDAYDQVTEQALKGAAAVVVLWSPRSVVSRWVRAEATVADRNGTMVPVTVDACERPIMFELTQTAELAHWKGDRQDNAWLALLADVRRRIAQRAPLLETETEAAAVVPTAAQPGKPRVVILPFVNMSGDAEQEYFSDGVTEDIITDLSHVAALSVVSRNAAFSYKGRTVSAASIAQALKVSHILEGSVRKAGDRVRITAQLLDAATDEQIWAERFDRTLDDIFAIQDEISVAVAAALKLHLAPAEKRAITNRPTANGEAYELFLMARKFERSGSERMKPLIVRICQRAVELDPGFAPAWALIAIAEAEMAQRMVAGASAARAREAAEQGLAIDDSIAETNTAMAEAIGRGGLMNFAAGQPFLEKALTLDPDSYDANLLAGYYNIQQGRWTDAIRFFEKACALDPDAVRPAGMIMQAYNAINDRPKALAAAKRALARCERALALEPDHSNALGFFITALGALGEADRAKLWANRIDLFDPENARLRYNVACGMAQLGEAETACNLLDRVVDRVSGGWLEWIEKDNDLDPIRDYPRFVDLIEQVKARKMQLADEAGRLSMP